MKEIKTKFGATIYVEELSHDRHYSDREDETKIKFFDSKERYLDYFEVDTLENNAEVEGITPEEVLNNYIKGIEACESVTELLEYIGVGWMYMSTDWRSVVAYMVAESYFDEGECVTKDALLKHEWVNIIGEHYVVVAEC